MKKLLTICILMSIMTLGYAKDNCKECPGVLLGKTYQEVQNVFKPYDNHYLIEVTDLSLVWYNPYEEVTKTYIFKRYQGKRYCTTCIFTLDCMSGEELIGSHTSDSTWIKISDFEWSYDTEAYYEPLTVTLQYKDDLMLFSYRYIPKEIK